MESYQEIENNTNLQNLLWHIGVMQFPCPVVTLVDPSTGKHVVLGVTDFKISDTGNLELAKSAYDKASSRGISEESLSFLFGTIMSPELFREPEEGPSVTPQDTLGSFLEAASEQASEGDLSMRTDYSPGPPAHRISL